MRSSPQGVGRPRDHDIDAAVLRAARELLVDVGYARVTMDATAARAGTSKAAIYRRFSSKAEMLFAATLHGRDSTPPPDAGSLRADLFALATEIQRQLSSPESRSVAAGVIAEIGGSPEVSEQLRAVFTAAERELIGAVLDRAVERGELRTRPRPETVHRLLGGGLIATTVAFDERLDDAALGDLVDIVTDGLLAQARR